MSGKENFASLNPWDWNEYQDLLDRFEEAWEGGQPVDLAGFLPPEGDPNRLAILRELVKSDIEIRWRHGIPARLEDYLERLPELGAGRSPSPQSIYEEYRVRQLYGDRPPLSEYRARFPGQFPALEQILRQQPVSPDPKAKVPETSEVSPPTVDGPPGPPERPSPARPGDGATPVSTAPASSGGTPLAARGSSGSRGSGGSQATERLISGGEQYRIFECIGRGTFAEVYRGEAPGGIPVAIKRLFKPIEAEEAQRELKALELIKQLHHPFLLSTHKFWIEEGQLLIVTDLADGTLRGRLRQAKDARQDGLPVEELLLYMAQAAQAIDYLHDRHVLHRDIKPENILLMQGFTKVADFGLARGGSLIEASATFAGTLVYMAPEIFRGKVSTRSDQYSLAVTYAELRMGRRPFGGRTEYEVMLGHLEGEADLGPLPAPEQKVVRKALARLPEQRYETCFAFVQGLYDALDEAGMLPSLSSSSLARVLELKRQGKSVEPPPPPPPPPWGPFAWALMLVLLLALLGGGALVTGLIPIGPRNGASAGPPFVLTLDPLKAMTLRPGEMRAVTLGAVRLGTEDPVDLTFPGLPSFLHIGAAQFAAGQDSASVRVMALPDAPPGQHDVTVRAQAGTHLVEVSFPLRIGEPAYRLPAGWRRPEGAAVHEAPDEGRVYYQRIEVVRAGMAVPFVLIPRGLHDAGARQPIATFYMMEDKVWLGLFRAFVAGERGQQRPLRDTSWENTPAEYHINRHDSHPVMAVVVPDAHRCAVWLGGQLPSPPQWDKAVGLYQAHPPAGPLLSCFWQVRLRERISGLALAGTPAGALASVPFFLRQGTVQPGPCTPVSPFGVRDLAGNGLEWTREVALDERGLPPTKETGTDLTDLTSDSSMYVRGWRFRSPVLPRLEELCSSTQIKFAVFSDLDREPEIGFRVVFEP